MKPQIYVSFIACMRAHTPLSDAHTLPCVQVEVRVWIIQSYEHEAEGGDRRAQAVRSPANHGSFKHRELG